MGGGSPGSSGRQFVSLPEATNIGERVRSHDSVSSPDDSRPAGARHPWRISSARPQLALNIRTRRALRRDAREVARLRSWTSGREHQHLTLPVPPATHGQCRQK
jgi:hypothetical protein